MAFRSDIIAGKAVIQVSIQDDLDRQLRLIKSKLFAFSNSISKIGQDLFATGSIGTLGAFLPVKQFVDFQDSLLFLQSKLRETGVDFAALTEYIRELGRTTSFTTREVAEGAAVLAQAGVGKGITDILLPSLDLARGARIDIDAAARILTNAITAFGVGFDQAATVASQLTTAARLGTTDIVLLGESLKESSTTFRQLNVPLADSLALITALSNVSLRGTKAGTSLNTAFANLASKMEELKSLGVEIDPTTDFQNPLELFTKIEEQLNKLQPTDQVRLLQSIFNIRGARGIGGVTVQGLEQLKNILDEVKASTTEARDNAILMDSRLGGAVRRTTSAFDSLAISIGSTAEGPLTKFLVKLKDLGSILSQLAPEFPKTTQWLLLLPVITLAAGAGLIALSIAASRFALLLTPLVALNGLLFASFRKLSTLAFSPIAAGFRLIYSQPVGKLSAKFRKENADILKAQTALDKQLNATRLNPGNIAQARTRLASAQAGRSFLNRPLGDVGSSLAKAATRISASFDNFFKTIEKAYLRGLTSFGRQSRIAARNNARLARPEDLFPRTYQIGLPSGKPLFGAPIAGKSGLAKQLGLDFSGPQQLDLDFDVKQTTVKSLSTILKEAVQTSLATINSPGAIKADPALGARIAQSIDDVIKGQGLPEQLRGTITKQVETALSKVATTPFKNRVFKTNPADQLDFFKELDTPLKPVQLNLFDDIIKKAPKATKIISQAGTTFDKLDGAGDVLPDFGLANISRLGDGFGDFVKLIGRSIRSLASILTTGFKSINFARIAKNGLTFAKVLGRITLGVGRLVKGLFSLTGLLTIIDFLIIAGPKIAPIKAIFEGIGKAFGAAFGTIKETFAALTPAVNLFKRSLENLISGDTETGLSNLKLSFESLVDILSSGFTLAWERFKIEAEKGIIFVKGLVNGLLGTLTSIGDIFGAVAGTLFSGRVEEGANQDPFEYGDGPINFLKSVFTSIFGALQAIGNIFITAADGIRTAVMTVWNMLSNIYSLLVNAPVIGNGEAAQQFNTSEVGQRIAIERGIAVAQARLDNYGSGVFDKVGEAGKADRAEIQKSIDRYRAALDVLGGTGPGTLESIRKNFNTSIEKTQQAFIDSLQGLTKNLAAAELEFASSKIKANINNALSSVGLGLNINEGVNEFLQSVGSEAGTGLLGLLTTITDKFATTASVAVKKATGSEDPAITRSRAFAKSLTGTVDQVRGQISQAIKNDAVLKEQEKTTAATVRTADGIDTLNNQATPFVFGA